jgi:hypothetical protein
LQDLVPAGSDTTCPAAVASHAYTAEAIYLLGPITAGGAIVSNLEADTDFALTTTQIAQVDVYDNTASAVVLSCNITSAATYCQNTGSANVAAGHFLEVKVTLLNAAPKKNYRVSFRY